MARRTKVATCCYCGTRAALVLAGTERHELACSACGAPLHDLKMLAVGERAEPRDGAAARRAPAGAPRRGESRAPQPVLCRKVKKKKKRRSLGRRFLSEAFDVLEDIFD